MNALALCLERLCCRVGKLLQSSLAAPRSNGNAVFLRVLPLHDFGLRLRSEAEKLGKITAFCTEFWGASKYNLRFMPQYI